jgi:hypothetical protein
MDPADQALHMLGDDDTEGGDEKFQRRKDLKVYLVDAHALMHEVCPCDV